MLETLTKNWSKLAIAALLGLGLSLSACGSETEEKPTTGTEKNSPVDADKAQITVECSGCKDTKTIGATAAVPEC